VATSVSKVAKASSKTKAENSSTVEVTDWDKLLINSTEDSTSTKDDSKEYEFFNGKDRLVRTCPGWGAAVGKQVRFVNYATDENGNPLPELPKTRFGSLGDVEYMEKKYPMSQGFYVNDQVCRNGRHRINVYRIHICSVVDKPVEVE
jgi:hypothetical protein